MTVFRNLAISILRLADHINLTATRALTTGTQNSPLSLPDFEMLPCGF